MYKKKSEEDTKIPDSPVWSSTGGSLQQLPKINLSLHVPKCVPPANVHIIE